MPWSDFSKERVARPRLWTNSFIPKHLVGNSQSRASVQRYGRRLSKVSRLKALGMTEGEYICMFIEQGCCCKICGSGGKRGQDFALDHDHGTGRIRGILCMGCNTALGHMADDPVRLRAGAAYLEDV